MARHHPQSSTGVVLRVLSLDETTSSIGKPTFQGPAFQSMHLSDGRGVDRSYLGRRRVSVVEANASLHLSVLDVLTAVRLATEKSLPSWRYILSNVSGKVRFRIYQHDPASLPSPLFCHTTGGTGPRRFVFQIA